MPFPGLKKSSVIKAKHVLFNEVCGDYKPCIMQMILNRDD